jgi:hypothetical protein
MRQRTWRDGWAHFPVDESRHSRMLQPERTERSYPSRAAAERDAIAMARDGWQVASLVDHNPPGLLRRTAVRCWCAAMRRPAPAVVVAYKRLH